jgi:spoIIIJ-associated protein
MTGFLGKIFGGSKKKKSEGLHGMVEELLGQVVDIGQLELDFQITSDLETGDVNVDFSGPDEELLLSKEGQLLDALQLFVRRAAQHQTPDDKGNINLDCNNFRQQANDALVELAEKLKGIALSKGKPVYFRALPPKDRKVIHQYLAEDGRVKSRSIGDGHFKKIKIFPIKDQATGTDTDTEMETSDTHDEVTTR